MGRVYNALAKADRLTGHERPIGRPAAQVAQPSLRAGATANRPDEQPPPFSPKDPAFSPGSQPNIKSNPVANEIPFAPPGAELFRPQATARTVTRTAREQAPARDIVSPRGSAISEALPPVPIFAEPREVRHITSLSIDPHLSALTNNDALACERYRTLAVRVSALIARRKLKTLLVTSAEQGEGKSAVAASLAWMMARRDNRRVLLIEAGLSPSALNIASQRGWLELADVSSALPDCIVRLDPNGLYVMSATGNRQMVDLDSAAADEALASSQLEKTLAELTGYFDFIIIDGPSICRSIGAQQLASIADGTILVARAGCTHHSSATTAADLVPQERRLGMVLNESDIGLEPAGRNTENVSIIRRLFGPGRSPTAK